MSTKSRDFDTLAKESNHRKKKGEEILKFPYTIIKINKAEIFAFSLIILFT